MTTKAVQYLVFEGKNFLLLMSVTIKQSDVSNNVRMGVLCYCYTFCGPLSPDWSPLSLHSFWVNIDTRAASGARDACSRLVWDSSQHYRPSPVLTLARPLSLGCRETLSVWISRLRGRMRGNR